MKNTVKVLLAIITIFVAASGYLAAQQPPAIHVETHGEGPAALLLPGLMSSGEVFDEMLSYLSKSHECHVVTFAGYAGKPAIEADRYLPVFQSAVEEYITENDLGTVTLLGHSLGGFLSLKIASDKQVDVKQVIILDALPYLAATMNPNAPEGFNESRARMYWNSTKGQDEASLREMRTMSLQSMMKSEEHMDEVMEWALASDLKTEAWTVMEMMGTDLRDNAASIEAPVLVLAACGGDNPASPAPSRDSVRDIYGEQYKAVPDLTLKVADNARHFIMYDDPEWVKKEVISFIKNDR